MKKILLIIGLAVCAAKLYSQVPTDVYLAGTLTTPGLGTNSQSTNIFLLSTNRMNVHSIQLSSSATGRATFYDCDATNSPFFGINFTNGSYWTRASYATNLVATNISGLTGTTNYFTNVGQWTYFVTNGANTNNLTPAYAAAWGANIAMIANNLNLTFARGMTVDVTTNVNYVIGYTP